MSEKSNERAAATERAMTAEKTVTTSTEKPQKPQKPQLRMPVVFAGHGSPMLALDDTEVTCGLRAVGQRIEDEFGKPRAILAVSAHWYTRGSFVQSTAAPEQIYDMYGFPKALYDFKYPVAGSPELGERVTRLLGDRVRVNDDWGIDHGTWTVLAHVFPQADVPVVQLSVDGTRATRELYEIGRALAPLRDEGYLVFGSGNVVHNLGRVDWSNAGGSAATNAFNALVTEKVLARDDEAILDYASLPNAAYAAPTPEHFLPLIYMLGAADGERPEVFNDHSELAAISMTGYAFGL